MRPTAIQRRLLLTSAGAAGILAAAGIGAGRARAGGTLRLGLSGGASTDTWNAATHDGAFMRVLATGAVFDTLTEIAADGRLTGELAEGWSATSDATEWTFQLRRGVSFHDGRPFSAHDAVASLHRHRATLPGAALLSHVADIRARGDHRLVVTLGAPDPDLPFLLSDPHLPIAPGGDAGPGIGTGLYRVAAFDPGRRATLVRLARHWKDGRAGWFDRIEALSIPVGDARHAALVTGRVDAIDALPPRAVQSLRTHPGIAVVEGHGNRHLRLDLPAGSPPGLRRALALGIDRAALVQGALHGFGAPAADHPVGPLSPHHDSRLAIEFDPDQARALISAAGLAGHVLPLDISDDVGPEVAEALMADAARIGLVARQFTQGPRAALLSFADGRPTEGWAFALSAPAPSLAPVLDQAGRCVDGARRHALYADAQGLSAVDGPALVPAFAAHLMAHATTLAHPVPVGARHGLDDARLIERWWFA